MQEGELNSFLILEVAGTNLTDGWHSRNLEENASKSVSILFIPTAARIGAL